MSQQVLPNERIINVAAEIHKAFQGIAERDGARREARDMLQDASNEATNIRENLLVSLSEIAARDKWSQYETEQGIEKALTMRNSTDKDNSVKTFASEIKRACHPNARQHVRALAALANEVWDKEVSQDKKLPRPCRDAFARKYHLLQRMIGEAVDTKRVLASTNAVVQFAVANDPRKNPERMFKKFKLLRDQLRELADDYPLNEIVNACEELREIALADFKHPGERPEKASAEAADAPETTSEGLDTGESASANVVPAQGVSDLLDEALADINA